MILACHHISKSFGTDVILDDISFHIEEHEKAAIVGIYAAGKSTLLKLFMEELSPDSGEVIISRVKRSVILLNIIPEILIVQFTRNFWM